ncbi:MAG: HAD hydrolase-like protein [Saccharofermentans sp.]|nr:HAD hydrolase-like protein [Saccharofermentans sp.]
MKYRYCLFDLDGTLTDPGIGITDSVMYALKKFDIDVKDRSELFPFIGPPLDYSFKTYFGFTEEQAVLAIKYYREFFSTKGLYENEVYEGIPGMLEELKKRGVTVALATSKPYEFSVEILRHFGLSGYFDHVGAATMDGRISKKEDVISNLLGQLNYEDKASVLMVGDRHHDIEGAKANGLHSAGVLWGYGTEEELKKAGAEYLFARPEDILRLL